MRLPSPKGFPVTSGRRLERQTLPYATSGPLHPLAFRPCFLAALAILCLQSLPGLRCAAAERDPAAALRPILSDKSLARAAVGISIRRLGETPEKSEPVFRQNAGMPMIPASNAKILTTSAALHTLGADFKFRTMLVSRGRDLILVGDGDPTFGDAELLRRVDWTATTVFRQWAKGLKDAGFSAFNNLIVDDGVFDETFIHPEWPADQLDRDYCAPVGGMNLNVGCIHVSVRPTAGQLVSFSTDPETDYVRVDNSCASGGANAVILTRRPGTNQIVLKGSHPPRGKTELSITIHDPGLYAGTVLAEILRAAGMTMDGKVVREGTHRRRIIGEKPEAPYVILAIHETDLPTVVTRANKESVNVYAESLCKRMGHAATSQPGSWTNGPAAIGAFLNRIGVEASHFHLDDGSGMSRRNRVSADAIVKVLEYNYHSRQRDAFIGTLAVGGEDGTLEQWFGNGLEGRVFAKTGYISGVRALSGYLKGRDGNWYAFSILMNDLTNTPRAKQLLQEIVKALDGR